jgi:transcriptional pleiotropic regulator of transition state genes
MASAGRQITIPRNFIVGASLPLDTLLTKGKNICMKAVKVTSKGQITIPVELRQALGIDKDTYLQVTESGNEIRLRKIVPARPLADEDPIWDLIGAADSRHSDVSSAHDRHLADAEIERWRRSS